MGETKTEIENAIRVLKLTNDDIERLDDSAGKAVFDDCLSHFVVSGDRRWWWEDFTNNRFLFKELNKPFELLNEILPDVEEHVWLIVEDDLEPFYPVYNVRAGVIKDIIGGCFAFEYYIINKNKEWLLCENHHNALIGIGNELRIRNTDRLLD